ncbi:MAG: bacteriohemerythrin [Ignavibacteriales bacterium]|nr:bacteriohemerythrin [Ignavibacteriales bacterium]
MPIIEWNDAFSVDIQKIDEQHKKFFSLVNLLYDSIMQGKGEEVVGSVLNELQQYVIFHFKSEESWMKLYHYPDMNKHMLEHQEGAQKINHLVLEYERGNKTVDIELLKFLSEWLQHHILEVDRKYIPYFQGKI